MNTKSESRSRRSMTAEQWNAKYPPGTPVKYHRGDGVTLDSKTRSAAWNLGHGEPVVLIENCSGGRALWALEPV